MGCNVFPAALAASLLFAAACGTTVPDFSGDGVVRFMGVEGGCWVIDTGDLRLEPINLGEDLRVDGLQVTFEAAELPEIESICQVGRIVEIMSIEVTGR